MTVSQSTIDASYQIKALVLLHVISACQYVYMPIIAKKFTVSRPTFASYHEVSDHVVLIDQC